MSETKPTRTPVKTLLLRQTFRDAAYRLWTRPMLGRDVFLRGGLTQPFTRTTRKQARHE